MIRKFILSLLTSLMILVLPMMSVRADAIEEAGFSIVTTPSSLQNSNNSYFDLKMQPEQATTLEIGIKNTTNQEEAFKIAVNPALTSDNIIIDYTFAGDGQGGGAQPNLQISQVVTLSTKLLTVPAQSQKNFTVQIKMPKTEFAGIMAGGIRVERVNDQEKGGITNQFAYVKGLVIRQNDQVVIPDIQFKSVSAGTFHYQPAVMAKFSNPTHMNISQLKITGTVINQKTQKTLVTKTIEDGSVAPNSTFNLILRTEEKIPSGTYQLKVTASTAQGLKWRWDESFTIAKSVNPTSTAFNVQGHFSWWWILIAVMVVVIVGLCWWIVVIKRRKKRN
ncbi:MAG: DUF916 and DUF3324 domain-containing protein [Streptococcaceae bacterium]|jgi:hypothetical protein|nr:DUF916 and DUF3324 domain-containing protein [Streptococcaceae bacterium]